MSPVLITLLTSPIGLATIGSILVVAALGPSQRPSSTFSPGALIVFLAGLGMVLYGALSMSLANASPLG